MTVTTEATCDTVGLTVGLIEGLMVGLTVGLIEGLMVGLTVGLIEGLMAHEAHEDNIKRVCR